MNGKNDQMKEIADFFRTHDGFGIISHVSPDGDTAGSVLALALALKKMGKKVTVCCSDPIPHSCVFLPGAEMYVSKVSEEEYPFAVAVDCADLARTGELSEYFSAAKDTVCIDHHMTNVGFAGLNHIEDVAATGELIYRLIRMMEIEPDKQIAECLFTAISTDTGNFAYSNTTSDSFAICAELMRYGIDLPRLHRLLFSDVSLNKVRVNGRVIANMRLSEDGKVAVSAVSQEDFKDLGAEPDDAENLIDTLRDIETVEAAALLKQVKDGSIRISLRGKTCADVSGIAVANGGGGHKMAAGCTMHGDLGSAEQEIYDSLREAVKAAKKGE